VIFYKIALLFIPPILRFSFFKKIRNYVLTLGANKKYNITIPSENYKRHAFVNKAVSMFNKCKYLEIGTLKNDLFDSIPLPLSDKYGVDPYSGGNFRMTSDDFFKNNSHLNFDVIFVDGLHEYLACQKDIINSMKALSKGGIIFIDDLLPKNRYEEKVPRMQEYWTGDVWKVAVELIRSKNVVFKIVNVSSGIGILKLNDNFEYICLPDLVEATYDDFLKYYKELPLIDSEQALKFIEENRINNSF
jgi:hypothetical protein